MGRGMNTPGYYGAASNLYGPDPRSAYYNPLLAFSPPPGGLQAPQQRNVADEYQAAYDRARMENLQRYQDILGGYAERYRRGVRGMEKDGDYERQDIKAAHKRYAGQLRQNLTNRGLTGSTIAPVMQRGAIRDMNRDVGSLNDRLRQQRRSLDANLSGDMLSFMERRTDSYPDMNQLINLQMLAGQAGAGTGGGGGPIYDQQYQQNWMPYGGGFNPLVAAAALRAGGFGRARGAGPRGRGPAGLGIAPAGGAPMIPGPMWGP